MGIIEDLLARRAALDKEIVEARKQEKASAISQVRALMDAHGLTMADIAAKPGTRGSKSGGKGAKVPAKFRNKATGETWSGRGLQPKWLRAAIAAGANLDDFAV